MANRELHIGVFFNRVSTTDDDIIHFWQPNESVYPTPSQVAQLYLAMSASSVPVESVFHHWIDMQFKMPEILHHV